MCVHLHIHPQCCQRHCLHVVYFAQYRNLNMNTPQNIQVYSLPAMERLQCIPTDTPINYTAMSPDMHSLAAVGDTPQM